MKGYWDIHKKCRLSYVLNKELPSRFDFITSVGIPVREDGRQGLRYEIGIKTRGMKRPKRRIITLFGTWRIVKGLKVLFEVVYEKRKVRAIPFSAVVKLGKGGEAALELKNRFNEKLGIKLKLTKKTTTGKGEAFLRGLIGEQEKEIAAGIGFGW